MTKGSGNLSQEPADWIAQRNKSMVKAQDRKDDARAKIIIGGAVLASVRDKNVQSADLVYSILSDLSERDTNLIKNVLTRYQPN